MSTQCQIQLAVSRLLDYALTGSSTELVLALWRRLFTMRAAPVRLCAREGALQALIKVDYVNNASVNTVSISTAREAGRPGVD